MFVRVCVCVKDGIIVTVAETGECHVVNVSRLRDVATFINFTRRISQRSGRCMCGAGRCRVWFGVTPHQTHTRTSHTLPHMRTSAATTATPRHRHPTEGPHYPRRPTLQIILEVGAAQGQRRVHLRPSNTDRGRGQAIGCIAQTRGPISEVRASQVLRTCPRSRPRHAGEASSRHWRSDQPFVFIGERPLFPCRHVLWYCAFV